MKAKLLTIPEIALIAGTRGALGAGAALLLGDKLNPDQRRAAGWALFLVGAITTVPLVMQVAGKGQEAATSGASQPA